MPPHGSVVTPKSYSLQIQNQVNHDWPVRKSLSRSQDLFKEENREGITKTFQPTGNGDRRFGAALGQH